MDRSQTEHTRSSRGVGCPLDGQSKQSEMQAKPKLRCKMAKKKIQNNHRDVTTPQSDGMLWKLDMKRMLGCKKKSSPIGTTRPTLDQTNINWCQITNIWHKNQQIRQNSHNRRNDHNKTEWLQIDTGRKKGVTKWIGDANVPKMIGK